MRHKTLCSLPLFPEGSYLETEVVQYGWKAAPWTIQGHKSHQMTSHIKKSVSMRTPDIRLEPQNHVMCQPWASTCTCSPKKRKTDIDLQPDVSAPGQ